MDYTQSDAFVTHAATGQRMHQDDRPIATEVSAKDMNSIFWSLMEVIKAAGVVPQEFDADVPATYQLVADAISGLSGRVASSIAELRSSRFLRANAVRVTGYYSHCDGGGGDYVVDPADSTSSDNGGTVIVGAGGRRWKLKYSRELSVKQFGARGAGLEGGDDTVAVQRTLDALALKVGGKAIVPAGLYPHTGLRLPNHVSLRGELLVGEPNSEEHFGSVLINTSDSISLTIGDGVHDVRQASVEALRITSTGSARLGVFASMWGNQDALKRCLIDHHVEGGVRLHECWNVVVCDNWIGNNAGYGVHVGNSSNNSHICRNLIFQNGTDGLQIEAAFNVIADENDFESNYQNQVRLMTGSNRGIVLTNSYFENLQSAGSGFFGIKIDANVADTVTVLDNFVDLSNATDTNPVCFLDIEAGNTRVEMGRLSFTNGSTPVQAAFAQIQSGAANCIVRSAKTINPVRNASPTSRVYYDAHNEVGVLSASDVAQAIPADVWTPLAFASEQYDTKGEWSGTNFRPDDFGLYEVDFSCAIGFVGGDSFEVRLVDITAGYEFCRIGETGVSNGTQSVKGGFKELLGPQHTLQLQIKLSAARSTAPGYSKNWVRIGRRS